MQLAATSPFTRTVQAEHAPRSHPILVPVRPNCWRRRSASVVAGSMWVEIVRPFKRNERGVEPEGVVPGAPLAGFRAGFLARVEVFVFGFCSATFSPLWLARIVDGRGQSETPCNNLTSLRRLTSCSYTSSVQGQDQ